MNSIIIYFYRLTKWIFCLWVIFHFNLSKANANDICQYAYQPKVSVEQLLRMSKEDFKNHIFQKSRAKLKNFVPHIPKVGFKSPRVHQLLEELFDTLSPFLIGVMDYLYEKGADISSSRDYTYELGSQHSGCIHTISMSRILSDRSFNHVSLQVKGQKKERGDVKLVFYRDVHSDKEERAFIENIKQALQEAKWIREHRGSHPEAITEAPIKFTSLEEIAEILPDPYWKCSAYCVIPPFRIGRNHFGEIKVSSAENVRFISSESHPLQSQAFTQIKKKCENYSKWYQNSKIYVGYEEPITADQSNACGVMYPPKPPNIFFDLHRFEQLKHRTRKKLSNRLSTSFDWIGF